MEQSPFSALNILTLAFPLPERGSGRTRALNVEAESPDACRPNSFMVEERCLKRFVTKMNILTLPYFNAVFILAKYGDSRD